MELAILCDAKVTLIIKENNNNLCIYDSEGNFEFNNLYQGNTCNETYSNVDVIINKTAV
jgi:hypothetical protein